MRALIQKLVDADLGFIVVTKYDHPEADSSEAFIVHLTPEKAELNPDKPKRALEFFLVGLDDTALMIGIRAVGLKEPSYNYTIVPYDRIHHVYLSTSAKLTRDPK